MLKIVVLALLMAAAVNCATSNKKPDAIILDPKHRCSQIKGVQSFDYKSFLGSQYKLEYFSDIPEAQDYESGSQISLEINKKWYFSFTIDKKNGSQETFMYVIDRIDGSTIYETLLVDGERSQTTNVLKIYGYKAQTYIQFVVCGQGTNPELRFALSFGDIELSGEEKSQILNNDKNLNFKSKLVETGNQGSGGSGSDDGGSGGKGKSDKDNGDQVNNMGSFFDDNFVKMFLSKNKKH